MMVLKFLSTPSARRATRYPTGFRCVCTISIHALREEGDPTAGGLDLLGQGFLSTPSARRATHVSFPCFHARLFLSTPSARRATKAKIMAASILEISIHALREEGDRPRPQECHADQISIHALREEGDHRRSERPDLWSISIHALREEGDRSGQAPRSQQKNFYPRPPRGGRPKVDGHSLLSERFLSTPSARRATSPTLKALYHKEISIHALREEGDKPLRGVLCIQNISIHALREEGDPCGLRPLPGEADFYPRPPRGGRPHRHHEPRRSDSISIHALREEGDASGDRPQKLSMIFLSTPSARRATSSSVAKPMACSDFYPRPPRGGRQRIAQHLVQRLLFLSTPSARRATIGRRNTMLLEMISIHALREEGDCSAPRQTHSG